MKKLRSISVMGMSIILLGLLSMHDASAQITYLDVGTSHTDLNATQNQSGTGWSWVAATKTFTLSGDITGGRIAFYGGTGDVNFVVSGTHTVTGQIQHSVGKLTISGGGTLTVNCSYNQSALSVAAGDLEITGATVNVSASGNNSHGVFVYGHNLIMSSGTLTASATGSNGYGISTNSAGDINISGTANVSATAANYNVIDCNNITVGGGTLSGSSSQRFGIFAFGTVGVSGGTLTANSSNSTYDALRSDGDITVTGGTLTTAGGSNGNLRTGGTLYVNGSAANVTVVGNIGKVGSSGGNLNVSAGTVTVGGTVGGTTTHTGGTLNGNTVSGAVTGSININNVYVVSAAQIGSDQSGSGWTWTASTATLTLSADPAGPVYFQTTGDVKLALSANVTIADATFGYAISSESNLTIDPNGNTLTVSSNANNGNAIRTTDGSALVIEGTGAVNATVTASATGWFNYAINGYNGVTVRGSVAVTATATGFGHGIRSQDGAITLTGNSTVTATGKGASGSSSYNRHGIFCANPSDITVSGNATVTGVSDGGYGNGIYTSDGSLTITGGASVNPSATSDSRIYADGNIAISTTGTVNANSTNATGIAASGDISITGGTVNATSTGTTDNADGIKSLFGNIAVSGGTVTATGGVAGCGLKIEFGTAITISGGDVTATVCGTLNHTGGTLNGITPPVTGTMDIGTQTGFDLANSGGGVGWAWDKYNSTLSLGFAYSPYTGEPIAINCAAGDNINIVYSGDVSVTNSGGSALYCNGSLNITGSGGTLTVNSGSSNFLHSAIDVPNGSLTIGGTAVVNATAACSGSEFDNAAVIYAKKGVTVSGSANVTTNATGANANGIYTELGDLTVSTTGTVTANGTGTGGALAVMNVPYKLNITGGTVALTGRPMNFNTFTAPVISGGTVTVDGTPVYLATVTLAGISTRTTVTAVSAPATGYGIQRMQTDDNGVLYFWLPAGSQTVTLSTASDTYSGTFTVLTDHTTAATLDVTQTPLTPGNSGTITVSDIGQSSLRLNWTAATGGRGQLQYYVFQSASPNLSTLGDCLSDPQARVRKRIKKMHSRIQSFTTLNSKIFSKIDFLPGRNIG